MLDVVSLRVSFAVVAVTLLALFYFVAYRSTRSAYAGWWCVALGAFLAGSAAYLLDGTSQQWWGNPLGNVCIVAGAASVWAGARAVSGLRVSWLAVAASLVVLLVASALDHPGRNDWSGGPFFLGLMTVYLALAATELHRAWRRLPAPGPRARVYRPILRSLTLMCTGVAAFYLARFVAFLAVGQDGRLFDVFLGSQVTTLVTTVMLATVSFSMTALSYADDTIDLRARATRDGLTGLLNRDELMQQLAQRWNAHRRRAVHGVVVMADLDHFKRVNDVHGHAAGDFALQMFAAACRSALGPEDLAGRVGGEEFVLYLDRADLDDARQAVEQVSSMLQHGSLPDGTVLPTVSYGLTVARRGDDPDVAIGRADRALYVAKSEGRDRVAVADGDEKAPAAPRPPTIAP
ncbi:MULTISPECIES: GGDEF domain-containing protein [Aeromicrobium]|jgi:diguanylate cyclase (GGDEF)-like protein|uniref:GGDEF domain-containing protein n=1 Tax=Aeromicrobium erythreum TaxID=2041 RepID=A0A0U3KEY8_9ACTN|nr:MULTISPECIES: GGDEF domain-containing protein [Aeromicrobium]ALX03571.1 hypothetical protein AERYTH_02090 [Aeromicrobium erythreum]MDR6118295.1 diguanylate cyclase (GGDEF)-like protein [Aeromicrobium sp. SORGH_AS_0981]